MENWKSHLLSFIAISTFLLLALASEDEDLIGAPCYDTQMVSAEPLTNSIDHTITYQVKIVDKETGQAIPNITVEVDVLAYNCQLLESCPGLCYMKTTYAETGSFIGLTNSMGLTPALTTSSWKALDIKDRVKLDITIKDEDQLVYAYKRKPVIVGVDQTNISITIPLIKDLL